jgi:hypothetical protein
MVYKDSNADDGVWANRYMVVTDYLGFRTKSLYDSRYRLVRTRKYKSNQDVAGTLDCSASLEVLISSEQNIYDIATDKVAQNIRFADPDGAAEHQVVTRNTYDRIGRPTRVESKTTDSAYQGDSVFRTLKESPTTRPPTPSSPESRSTTARATTCRAGPRTTGSGGAR